MQPQESVKDQQLKRVHTLPCFVNQIKILVNFSAIR